jgi:hypothetical protein
MAPLETVTRPLFSETGKNPLAASLLGIANEVARRKSPEGFNQILITDGLMRSIRSRAAPGP